MKRRVIYSQYGNPGIQLMEEANPDAGSDDVRPYLQPLLNDLQIYNLYLQHPALASQMFPEYSEEYTPYPTPSDMAMRIAEYSMYPPLILQDYISSQEWVPDWLKTAFNVGTDIAMAAGGRPGRKGATATGRDPSKSRGLWRADLTALLVWNNIEAFGELPSRKAGEGYVGKDGNVHYRGNVGRPIKKRGPSALFQKLINGEMAAQLEVTPARSSAPARTAVGVGGRRRGRVPKAVIELMYTLKDPIIGENPTPNEVRAFRASFAMKLKSYAMREAALVDLIKNSPQNSPLKYKLEQELGILRKRLRATLNAFRTNKYYDNSFN